MTEPTHRWQFTRSGGFDQARLDSAADFASLDQLDQKLWAALACPARGLEFDERTLALIDGDKDGRVRAPEIIAAVRWCGERLKDLAALKDSAETLPLERIDASRPAGRALLASAKQILKDGGKADAKGLSLAEVAETAQAFAGMPFNGDGIVPPAAASDPATRKVIEDVIACLGAVTDRSGQPGVNQARVDDFFAQLEAAAAWAGETEKDTALRPLGDATPAAVEAWRAVRSKVDDWFARGRLAEFDERALAAVNRSEAEYLALAARDMTVTSQEVAGFPIARVRPGQPLGLGVGVNPAWRAALETLRTTAIAPLLGKDKIALTADEWTALSLKLAPYEAWLGRRPAGPVAALPLARMREILGGSARADIAALIAQDQALAPEAAAIADVEQLVRYHRDLYRLLLNFVNFADFYSADRWAIFQVGTLYLDARACELCVRVEDAGKHAALAGLSRAFLAYCDCTRPGGEKMQIAAAFTGGDSDFLRVGRNGLFYDRKGRDWDATIVKVVENPISLRQAFWSPYKKLMRMIEDMVAKRAATKEAESEAKMSATSESVTTADQPKPAEPKKIDVGTVAALGVAVGAIGTLLTALVGYAVGLFTLPFWKLALAIAGILLLISTPALIIAWLKLRQRNIGPILDANGWAVNGRVKLNVKFGESLTQIAKIPPGSHVGGTDPFGDRPNPWPKLLLVAVCIAFVYSFLGDPNHGWLYSWTAPGTAFHERMGFSLGERKPSDAELAAQEAAEAEGEAKPAEPAVPATEPPK